MNLYNILIDRTSPKLASVLGIEATSGILEYDKLRYGVAVLYINLLKGVLVVALSLALGILHFVAIFVAAYVWLRAFSFGVHLKSSIGCTLLSLFYYIGSSYLALFCRVPLSVKVALLVVCLLLFLRYAPAATEDRPIYPGERRKFRRRSVVSFCVVASAALALASFQPIYSTLLVLAALCQTLNLLPCTYILFRRRFDHEAMAA